MPLRFHSLTLRTRVLLVVAALIVPAIWGVAAWVAVVLQADMERLLSAQLSATVDLVATDLDGRIQTRIEALKELAATITPIGLANVDRVQHLLETRSIPKALFPTGVFVTNKAGNNIADYPTMRGRVGGYIGDREYFKSILSGRGQSVSAPLFGRFSKQPVISLAVPLRDFAGTPIGALVAAAYPSDPNLFGIMGHTRVGKTGYVLVFSPADKLIVSATDKSRLLQALPPKGVNPLMDKWIDESTEGTGITKNSLGVELLIASRNMKLTGWAVIAGVATDEAFAPIAKLKQQIYIAALLMSLVVVVILRIVLGRQLAPLTNASEAIRRMTEGKAPFAPLPVQRDDEIGGLIRNFNQLVAERMQSEELWRLDQERLRNFFEALPLAVGHADREGRITFGNRRFFALEESQLQPIGRTLREAVGEDGYAVIAPYIDRAMAGEDVEFQRSYGRADGTQGTRLLRYVPHRNLIGEVVGVFGMIEDITEREHAQAALRESEQRFRSFFQRNQAVMLLIEPGSGAIVDANDAAVEFYAYTRERLCAINIQEINQLPAEQVALQRQAALGDHSNYFVFPHRLADGRIRTVEVHSTPINANGHLLLFSIVHDITDRKMAEAEVRKLNNELEARVVDRTRQLEDAYKGLESFAYSVAHDLRSPLRGINGFATILVQDYADQLDAAAQDHLKRIRAGTERMGMLIDDLSTLTRVSRAPVDRTDVDLSELVGEVMDSLQSAEPGRQVELVIAPNMRASADRGLLRIALDNLLGNAWKFTSKIASARIEVGMEFVEGGLGYFVRDNGIGFDPVFAHKLFGQFERLHPEDEYEGTGVGLAIVDRVVRRHGGSIWAEGSVGGGATFHFTL